MTSREQVLKAVNFERPDRVPINLNAMRASGINAVVSGGKETTIYIEMSERAIRSPIPIILNSRAGKLSRSHLLFARIQTSLKNF